MTTAEIIDETVEFYTKNPRARVKTDTSWSCFYHHEDGRMCAVGRCLIDPSLYHNGEVASSLIRRSGDNIFKKKYRGHSSKFWRKLQQLHDDLNDVCWMDGGLSNTGKKYVENLKREFPHV